MSFIFTVCLLFLPQGQPLTAEAIVEKARQAMGYDKTKIPATGLQFQGKGTFAGMPARFTLLFNRSGHYVQRTLARLSTGSGFDGNHAWIKDLGGEERIQELADRRNTIFMGLVLSGLWLDPASGMKYQLPGDAHQNGVYTLQFEHSPTETKGTIQFDSKTGLPRECHLVREARPFTVRWKETLEYAGMKWPKETVTTSGRDSVETFSYESIQPAPTFVRNPFAPIILRAKDVKYDNTRPAALVVKRAPTGHLLVKPLINGKDVGWFIFDSGAGANCLDNKTIKELGLDTFGELPAIGIGGAVKTSFCQPETIQLGRATFERPMAIGLDLAFLDAPMGVHIAGVLGYGVFHRCIVEVDMRDSQIALYDPEHFDDSKLKERWQKLYQTARVACVEAEFEGHKGIFKLDTGAANSTVAIHAPIVEKFKLLENRELKDSMSGGVGGMIKAKSGKLSYFELGGHRTENVEATFATANQGAFNTSDTLGNIGGELLKPFKLVFDYQGKRIAFLQR